MQSGRWVLVVVGALVACGDNRDAPRDGAVGSDDADEVVADGAVDAPDATADAPPDGPVDAGIDAAPRCGDGHLDPGEECDEGIEGLSGDGCSSTCTTEEMSWTNLTPNPTPPLQYAAIAYDSIRHKLVLFGGYRPYSSAPGNETWEFDGTTWTQILTLVSPPARARHSMVFDSTRGCMVVAGRADGSQTADTWEWDGVAWTQRVTATAPPLDDNYLAYDPVRQVTVLWTTVTHETWEYDGVDWTDKTAAGAPDPTSYAALTYAGADGVMLVDGAQNYFWDGSSWTTVSFSAQVPWNGSLLSSDPFVLAAYDSIRDRVIAVDNVGSTLYGLGVWEWINGNWVNQPSTAPRGPLADRPAIAFDSTRALLTLFIGYDAPWNHSQTWDWDGSRWSEHYDSIPPPRTHPQLAYDARRARIVMFGGGMGREPFPSDTWEWDGTTWTSMMSSPTPGARVGAGIAYDERRGVVVMYGGAGETYDSNGNAQYAMLADTWEWDGVSWLERTSATSPGPIGAIGTGMTYDRAHGYILLFHAGTTWTWDGITWSQRSTPHVPATVATDTVSLVYDSRRGTAVLYIRGGAVWDWDGVDWNDRGSAPEGDQLFYDPVRGRDVLLYTDRMMEPVSYRIWDGAMWSGPQPIAPGPTGYKIYDPTTRSWFSFGDPAGWDTWLARSGANDPHEQCDGSDVDGDGLTRCADPDCWWRCTPLCAPGDAYCDPNAPRCGDGTCSSIEDSALCPADCP